MAMTDEELANLKVVTKYFYSSRADAMRAKPNERCFMRREEAEEYAAFMNAQEKLKR